jgi:hypothetical protein
MRKIAAALVAALAIGIAGCADAPTASPTAAARPAAQPAPREALLGLVALTPALQRSTPLAADIVVRKSIGVDGGTITIPEAGLTVVVPRYAVSQPTDFTVTAIAGRAVAYEFTPEGARFARKLKVTQSLRGTEWLGLPLLNFRAVYFKDRDQVDPINSLIQVDEVLPLALDLLRLQVSFDVEHFSGYGISTGRASSLE